MSRHDRVVQARGGSAGCLPYGISLAERCPLASIDVGVLQGCDLVVDGGIDKVAQRGVTPPSALFELSKHRRA